LFGDKVVRADTDVQVELWFPALDRGRFFISGEIDRRKRFSAAIGAVRAANLVKEKSDETNRPRSDVAFDDL
jgi:hypothetical protein